MTNMVFFPDKNSFHGNLRINDRDFSDELNDPTTTEFQTLKNELQPELQKQICDGILSCEVNITRFSPGSIVCDFEIHVESSATMNEYQLEINFEAKLNVMNITGFDISPGTISNCSLDEAETTPGICTKCPDGQIPDTNDKTKCLKGIFHFTVS